ncbi:MAG: hypothetical protein KatS3mg008_1288 [Acidimicrobiales bacterium]|nr:MAG: hypothetical protein KatS3mg008_1288 [Acidimicrobiales bacterium]
MVAIASAPPLTSHDSLEALIKQASAKHRSDTVAGTGLASGHLTCEQTRTCIKGLVYPATARILASYGESGMKRHDWDSRYEASAFPWTTEPNRFLVERVGGLPPGRALDWASGEGRNAVWLASRGWEVTAVDFSLIALRRSVEFARAKGVRLAAVCADVVSFEPPPRLFDLVVVAYLQLRAHERRVSLRAAAGGVGEGGRLFVVAHHPRNIEEGWGGPQDPTVLYTAEDVVEDLEGLGLVFDEAAMVRRPVETEEGVREALDTLVWARRTD